jgi:P-type E1-E2 ATPase
MVRGGELIPVDGFIISATAVIDEAALTGEPIPTSKQAGELARSGTVNAGDTFEISTSGTASESTYAGIVRMVQAAQMAKAPFIRVADRYALLLLPVALAIAGVRGSHPAIPSARWRCWSLQHPARSSWPRPWRS